VLAEAAVLFDALSFAFPLQAVTVMSAALTRNNPNVFALTIRRFPLLWMFVTSDTLSTFGRGHQYEFVSFDRTLLCYL
jgi:hypothetical protein